MTYFDPPEPKPRHKCEPPKGGPGMGPRGWRCEAGHAYIAEQVTERNETWWQWRRAPELDEPSEA